MTKKFIFIPVVNNFDLLEKAINSVPDGIFDDYFVFNNSNEKIPINLKQFKVIDRFGRLTFKQTQNCMREYAINNNYDVKSHGRLPLSRRSAILWLQSGSLEKA